MLPMSFRLTLVGLCAVACGATAGFAADVPRYKLEVGQELTYRISRTQRTNDEQFPLEGLEAKVRIDILGEATGGGWKVAIVRNLMLWSAAPGVIHKDGSIDKNDSREVILGTLRPDGRLETAPNFGGNENPQWMFALLPGAEGSDSYRVPQGNDASFVLKVLQRGPEEWRLLAAYESPQTSLTGFKQRAEVHFDVARGLATRVDTMQEGSGLPEAGKGLIELVSVENRGPAWMTAFASDAERFSVTMAAYRAAMDDLPHDKQQATEAAAKARGVLAGAIGQVKSEELAASLKEEMRVHDIVAKGYIARAAESGAMVGKQAPDFNLKRVGAEGTVSLNDLAGKVVLLDFWYRRCGACMASVPEINQLVTELKGKPVVVLGMNVDSDEQDAKIAAETMKMNYPSLRLSEDLAGRFGVTAYPTVLVLDQHGMIRGTHVGVGSTSRAKIAKEIEDLLSK